MSSQQLKRVMRELTPLERVALAMRGLVSGAGEDPLIRSTIPRGERADFSSLMGFGNLVLTRLRPATAMLEMYVMLGEAEVQLLQTRRAWGAERLRLLPIEGESEEEDGPRQDGPTLTDLRALAELPTHEFIELDFTDEDRAMKVGIENTIATLRSGWDWLLALEEAVPIVGARLNRSLAEEMLGDRLRPLRIRLERGVKDVQTLVGPIDIEEFDGARRAMRILLDVKPGGRDGS